MFGSEPAAGPEPEVYEGPHKAGEWSERGLGDHLAAPGELDEGDRVMDGPQERCGVSDGWQAELK